MSITINLSLIVSKFNINMYRPLLNMDNITEIIKKRKKLSVPNLDEYQEFKDEMLHYYMMCSDN